MVDHEVRHIERLRASLAAGPRRFCSRPTIPARPIRWRWAGWPSTPLAISTAWRAGTCSTNSRLNGWAIRAMGGFSVNREGVDRQAINMAIELLAGAKRPLVIFPEGATSRTADHLQALLDGVAFIARAAAKKRLQAIAARQGRRASGRGEVLFPRRHPPVLPTTCSPRSSTASPGSRSATCRCSSGSSKSARPC